MRNFTSVTKAYYNGEHIGYVIVDNGKTSHVPLDSDNSDYRDIQEWIADGNTVTDNGGGG